jgi:hypothetical protein
LQYNWTSLPQEALLALQPSLHLQGGPMTSTTAVPRDIQPTESPFVEQQKKSRQGDPANIKQSKARQPRNGAKSETILSHLRRRNGVTIAILMKATGWQSHSIRGFLSRLKENRALRLASQVGKDGQRRYRVTGGK